MPQNQENLQFLICSGCNGIGHLANKKCQVCNGKGVVGYLDGYLLSWSRKINHQYIKLYKIERLINKLVFLVLFVLGALGLASLVYSIYLTSLIDVASIIKSAYWLAGENTYLFIFWISLLFDMYIIYYLSLSRAKKGKVISKKYQSDEQQVIAPPPVDWTSAGAFSRKNKIDVAKSFSPESIRIVEKAFELADKYKAIEVGPVHYLIAAILESKQIENIFVRLDIDMKVLAEKIGRVAAKYPQSEGDTVMTSKSIKILLKAYRLSYDNKLEQVDTAEIVHESIKADEMIQEVFVDMNVTLDQLDNVIMWLRITNLMQQQWRQYRASSRLKSKSGIDRAMTAVQTQFLNQYSDDLTMMAKMGYLPLCINRDKEFQEMFRILEGSSNQAIVLVGDPGVGKTAMIEGLAQKMIADDVPGFLYDKRLVSLSVSRLISGASATEAQERLLICINEIANAGNVILFIDNIHDIMGVASGGTEGFDLSDVLVEGISKGFFVLISSTSRVDYGRTIESTSLGNIMKKVEILEPEENLAIQILEGKIGSIEAKNHIYFSYKAIENAVKLTDRYINDQFLPYKAVTLLEEVAVWARKNKGTKSVVSGNDVSTLLSEKINMPVSDVTEKESEKLLNLEEIIHERMVDQEEAVSAVADSLRRARAELRDQDRPISNLLFLGPTGVGKTELAKQMAAVYFGSEENMIRMDMSEYQESDSVNRLIGAPPSGGGVGTAGQLTEAVRKKPFAILLLDELEKAHPNILTLFLQVMEDGRLTDATGRTVDFTNVILIATSNAGTSYIQEQVKAGTPLEQIKQSLLETELKQSFRPEFLNRFDNIIVFKPLELEHIVKIAKIMLNDVAKNLEVKGIKFQATDAAIEELAQIGFDPQFGARPLRRAIQDKVDSALAKYMLTGKINRRDMAVLDKGGEIRIEKAKQL
jgi:ATP-dependent Clp protease ATP-binding subunit ClpC